MGSLPAGWLAARVGVKPTVLLGLALLAVTSLVFGFAQSVLLLDIARFAQGVGGACSWAGGLAWLVSASPADQRGTVIGSALGAAIVGVLLGPALGGLATLLSPKIVFSGVAVLAAGLAAWAWSMPGIPAEPSAGMRAVGRALRSRPVIVAFWLFTLPAIFAGVLEVLAPLRLDELGASGAVIGGIFLVVAGAEAVLSPWSGRLSDRHGRLAPIRVGLAGAIVMAGILPLPTRLRSWAWRCSWPSRRSGRSGHRRWRCSRMPRRAPVWTWPWPSGSPTWPGRPATWPAAPAARRSPTRPWTPFPTRYSDLRARSHWPR